MKHAVTDIAEEGPEQANPKYIMDFTEQSNNVSKLVDASCIDFAL